jgi:2-amino-4-hydroxy-6-hydroxymethyldihydropteridine diphosphokinase
MATQNLILATGSNLENKKANLAKAVELLQKKFILVEQSKIYESKPVDFLDQPDFLNQVIHFSVPEKFSPNALLEFCLQVEKDMGRVRGAGKGPRVIDIDIIFLDEQIVQTPKVQIPHPRWKERSFVVKPLMELAIWKRLRRNFPLPAKIEFQIDAFPLK